MLRSQRMVVILFTISAFVLVTTLAALHAQNRSGSNSGNKEEPTPIRRGLMTEVEKEHSRIYRKEYEQRRGRKLGTLNGTGEVEVIIGPPSIPISPHVPAVTVAGFLKNISCEADAVVVVTVTKKSSQITEDETFTFTQFEAIVEEILKDNASAPIQRNSQIMITRPGGAIEFDRRVIRVTDASFPPLRIGARYLLFLKFIPSTGTYKAFTGKSDFELQPDKYIALTKEARPSQLSNSGDVVTLLMAVRTAVSSVCAAENGRGGR
jgi:hypothetical protein